MSKDSLTQSTPMWITGLKSLPLRQALNICLAVGVLSLSSQCALPFYPVPLTLQTLAVMGIAFCLTPGQSVLSVLTWITSGAMGAPVFYGLCGGPGVLFGPRGGYLWGMLISSFVVSWIRFKGWPMIAGVGHEKTARKSRPTPFLFWVTTAFIGDLLTMALGWAHLCFLLGDGYKAWSLGVIPFMAGETFKIMLVSTIFYYFQKPFNFYDSSSY